MNDVLQVMCSILVSLINLFYFCFHQLFVTKFAKSLRIYMLVLCVFVTCLESRGFGGSFYNVRFVSY